MIRRWVKYDVHGTICSVGVHTSESLKYIGLNTEFYFVPLPEDMSENEVTSGRYKVVNGQLIKEV